MILPLRGVPPGKERCGFLEESSIEESSLESSKTVQTRFISSALASSLRAHSSHHRGEANVGGVVMTDPWRPSPTNTLCTSVLVQLLGCYNWLALPDIF